MGDQKEIKMGANTILREIQETSDFLNSKIPSSPEIGMITGTGLGDITVNMELDLRIPFEEIQEKYSK